MKRKIQVVARVIQVVSLVVMFVLLLISTKQDETAIEELEPKVKVETPEVISEVQEVPIQNSERVYFTYIDKEYVKYAEEISEIYDVCPELIIAIIEYESDGMADAENQGCIGLMQVSERWHKDRMERLGVESLFDPRGNILVGVDYLTELADKYEDLYLVLMIYNGSADAKERHENGTPTEYARGIVNRSRELELLHGR